MVREVESSLSSCLASPHSRERVLTSTQSNLK
jgi:hypothetical protein